MNGNTDNNVFEQYAELVRRVKAGDESAFTEIYEKSQKLVYTTCLGILNNEQDAEDAMQETYITVYDKISTLEDEKTFVHWLKTVAANKARDKFKLKKDNLSYEDAVATEEDLMGDDNLENLPDSLVLEKDKRDTLHKIMRNELSDAQYQTLLLYYYDELKISEIANVMECPEETIKSRLKASRIKLKTGIEAFEKKNGVSLMGGVAGAQTLGNFFKSFYGSAKGPSIKSFPVKLATGPNPSLVASKAAAKTGAKAGGKAVAHSAAKTAGGASVTKIAGIATASVLGLGLIGGAALSIKKMIDENKLDDGTVYELDYKGLYCNIDEDENVNECYRFYSNGDVIHASYEFDNDDECFPVGDWFNQGSDDDRVETGTFEADEGKLEVTLEHKSKDIERSGTIGKKSIVLDDVEYEFYKFSDIPGYITEFTPEETTTDTESSDPTVTTLVNSNASVTDFYYEELLIDKVKGNDTALIASNIYYFTYGRISSVYRIPQVDIEGVDTSAINQRIQGDITSAWSSQYGVDYIYYIDEDVVSICIRIDEHSILDCKDNENFSDFEKGVYRGEFQYLVYNISVETGTLLSDSELLEMNIMTTDEFAGLVDSIMRENTDAPSDETYTTNKIFVAPNGHLCFAGSYNTAEYLFDTKSRKVIDFYDFGNIDESKAVVIANNPVSKQYDVDSPSHFFGIASYTYVIPEVLISGIDTTALNEKIMNDLSTYHMNGTDSPPVADYVYYVSDNVICLCIKLITNDYYVDGYKATEYINYCISVKTGEFISANSFLGELGTDSRGISAIVDSLATGSYDHYVPFASPEGHICVAVCYDEQNTVVYDTVTREEVTFESMLVNKGLEMEISYV